MKQARSFPEQVRKCWDEIAWSSHWTEGKYVRKFEDEVARLYGGDYTAIACSSAGAGLYMLAQYYRYLQGVKRAVVSNNTFAATALMPAQAGMNVTVLDNEIGSFSLGVRCIRARKSQLMILTHIGGEIAPEYAIIAGHCASNGIYLIEDAAHAFGATGQHGIRAGQLSDAAVFSFYPTKAVPVGEGGVIVTRNKEIDHFCRMYRNYGKVERKGVIEYSGIGFNFRMDEWTAAVAYCQVLRLDDIIEQRKEDAEKLSRIVPSVLTSSNWYKYIVSSEFKAKQQVGKVYQKSDQIRMACRFTVGVDIEAEYPGGDWVDKAHICLPIGENMYEGMSTGEIEQFLGVE